MHIAALIVAAGRGTRAGGGLPKQYRLLAGEPLLARTIQAVLAHPRIDSVTCVIGAGDAAHYEITTASIEDDRLAAPVTGGDSRSASVRNGLDALAASAPDYVLIHDGARPFVSEAVVSGVIDALSESQGAFPAIPATDALWRMPGLQPVSRDGLARAQTPQGFHYTAIAAAHAAADSPADDDVALARAAGLTVTATQGDPANEKITHPGDFARAEARLRRLPDVRTGQGFDVHAFEAGDHVTLCGVDIPHSHALKGHSDADVAMHTLTDAIYGALGEGDIGQWFPPSEARWKGAASRIFLEHAMMRIAENGFTLTHMDVTIICEAPKIGPHAQAMRECLSAITGIEVSRISVKATTSEKLGFTGRSEGIAAMATATLVRG